MAATIAACLAASACGSARAPVEGARIGNDGGGAMALPSTPMANECERTTDLPPSAGSPTPGGVRGIVVDGAGVPVDGAEVTIGGGTHKEVRNGHTLTRVHGTSSSWTNYTGGFRFASLQPYMVDITVTFGSLKIHCRRGSADDDRGYVIRMIR